MNSHMIAIFRGFVNLDLDRLGLDCVILFVDRHSLSPPL